jgi:hypothetical protein
MFSSSRAASERKTKAADVARQKLESSVGDVPERASSRAVVNFEGSGRLRFPRSPDDRRRRRAPGTWRRIAMHSASTVGLIGAALVALATFVVIVALATVALRG